MSTSIIKFKDSSSFFSHQEGMTDLDNLKETANSLSNKEREMLNGVLYVHSIADLRIGAQMIRHLRVFRMICGDKALRNCVIVTTGWDTVDDGQAPIHEMDLVTNPKLFKPLLDAGCRYFRYNNTLDSARQIISHLLDKQSVILQIQDELAKGIKIEDTAAGVELMVPVKVDEMCDGIWEAIFQERGKLENERDRWDAWSRQLEEALLEQGRSLTCHEESWRKTLELEREKSDERKAELENLKNTLKEQEESWRRQFDLERADRMAEREKFDGERRKLEGALKEQGCSLHSQAKDLVLQELEQWPPCGPSSAQSDLYEFLRSGMVGK